MKEAVRWLGDWCLPGAPNGHVAGTLLIGADDSIELELMAFLTDGHPDNRYPVVLGTTREGGLVTLQGVLQVGSDARSSRALPEPVRFEKLAAHYAYIGAHLATPSDRAFRQATFSFTDMYEWVGDSGFRLDLGALPGVAISYDPPPEPVARLDFGTVSISQGWSTISDGLRSRGIARNVAFRVAMDEPHPLEEWLSTVVQPLRHFMTFATERPNEVTELTFAHPDQESEPVPDQIGVRYERVSTVTPSDPPRHWEFLIDCAKLGEELPVLLTRWFELMDKIGAVIDRFFAPRYRPVTFIENRFLDVIEAAEGYHRATSTNEVLPKKEHKHRVASIVEHAPEEHKDWLKEQLANSNEPTLRDRLAQLHERVAAIVAPAISSASDYVGPVVDVRNALIHPGTRGRPMPTGREVWRMTERTTLLLTACLLQDLGFSDERAAESIRRTRRFRLLTEVL